MCPSCDGGLVVHSEDLLCCAEGHHFTAAGVAARTNSAALRALWRAIRALEYSATNLEYLVTHHGGRDPSMDEQRRGEAQEARQSAEALRTHAASATTRLNTFAGTLSSADRTYTQHAPRRGPVPG